MSISSTLKVHHTIRSYSQSSYALRFFLGTLPSTSVSTHPFTHLTNNSFSLAVLPLIPVTLYQNNTFQLDHALQDGRAAMPCKYFTRCHRFARRAKALVSVEDGGDSGDVQRSRFIWEI
jgi:hypothetical protein